ncbi:putative 2-ketoarginine decarboxylase AruI [Ktedonobacteria bacterium brp13]|nr:putative 2-ketoarginine decarboxylase AruI [Ktedonobacteria bacterium brp13]
MTSRQHITGAQAVIATLRAQNVDTIFGIPGVHTLPLYEAIYLEPGLRHILARHEQGAGFMAEGYARATGKIGVVCTIPGPGVTNVTTAVASAYADSIPLLVISGALPRKVLNKGNGELHEVKNQLGIMEALAGWTRSVNSIEEIPGAINEAFHVLQSTRPRSAYIQIPYDLLIATAEIEIPLPIEIARPQPPQEQLLAAAQLLLAAKRPFIIAGAGVTAANANEQLCTIAEHLQAPVLLSSKSHDVLPTTHPLVIATNDSLPLELDTFIAEHDVVLVVGSKLGAERTAGQRLPLPEQLIHIDIDPTEISHNYPAQIGIVADASSALNALLTILNEYKQERSAPTDELNALREALHKNLTTFQGENLAFLDGLNTALTTLPADTLIVADMTMLGYAAAQALPMRQPRTFIHPSELCTIGSALPLAIGAQVALPDQHVIALCGDGGFLLNASEMATAAQERLPLIIIIFNDATFTRVKADQKLNYAHHYIATDVLEPDYVTLAHAFHIKSTRVETPTALSAAIQEAAQQNGPTLIDVMLAPRQW